MIEIESYFLQLSISAIKRNCIRHLILIPFLFSMYFHNIFLSIFIYSDRMALFLT